MVSFREISEEEWDQLKPATTSKSSPWDTLLDAIETGKVMQVEELDSKKQRGARIALSRRAKQRGITLEYRPTETGLAVRREAEPRATNGQKQRGRKRKTTEDSD